MTYAVRLAAGRWINGRFTVEQYGWKWLVLDASRIQQFEADDLSEALLWTDAQREVIP